MNGAGAAASNWPPRKVEQAASHLHLSPDLSRSPLRSTRARLDAIIVPASRPASFLQPAIELSANLDVLLIVLCSKQTKVEQVAERVARMPSARSLIVPIPDNWSHPAFPTRTSERFRDANANRRSDLSAKRNVGLLLARLNGWNKIVFLDDDVTLLSSESMARLAGQLGKYVVAGMVVQPDNSVVCFARRLARLPQGVFLTGAVLGVHCNSLPLSFFPDIYNEDWFFFAKQVAARALPQVGQAKQIGFDPFASPDRAREEEFGDLLAEGLYALIGEQNTSVRLQEQLSASTETYWSRFIEARRQVLRETTTLLLRLLEKKGRGNGVYYSALASLAAAETQLDMITPDLCVEFIDAWREDLGDWQSFSNGVNSSGSTREAMEFLELKTWTLVQFGAVVADSETASGRLRLL